MYIHQGVTELPLCTYCLKINCYMQGVRAMLRNSEEVASLLQDWRRVDTDSMVLQAQQSGSSCGEDLFRECKYTMVHE